MTTLLKRGSRLVVAGDGNHTTRNPVTHKMQQSLLGRLSRWLSRLTGGQPGQTLCARIAASYGTECLFCRLMGLIVEPEHCRIELIKWEQRHKDTQGD